jgi:hypothetical protein
VRFVPVDFAAVAAAMGVGADVAGDLDATRRALRRMGGAPLPLGARIGPAGYRQLLAVSPGLSSRGAIGPVDHLGLLRAARAARPLSMARPAAMVLV